MYSKLLVKDWLFCLPVMRMAACPDVCAGIFVCQVSLFGECQWLAVHAGCLHGGCRAGIDSAWLALPSSPMHDADEKPDA